MAFKELDYTEPVPVGTKVTLNDEQSMNLVVVGWDSDLAMYRLVASDVWPLKPGNYISYVLRRVDFEIKELPE